LTSIGSSNEEISGITVNREDRITVVGSTEGTAGRVLVVARFKANGEPDLSFGEQGVSLVGVGGDATAEGILERQDGTLVLSGSYQEDKVASLMLVGLGQDGLLDTGFGDKGVAVPAGSFTASEGYGLAEDDRSGMLYLAAAVGPAGQRDTALFRFTREGKADVSFGSQGALVTKVSAEDDVLYDVVAGESGVVASGFTTDAGTRQFLMASYPQGPAMQASADQAGANAGVGAEAMEPAPIQEVRVNGKTRVQIRKMQVASSYADYTTTRSQPSLPASGVQATNVAPAFSAALGQIENFLLPSAHADVSAAAATEAPAPAQIVTTTFSAGESVSYAAAFDGSANIVAVGTADGPEASSIVVARYAAEVVDDSIVDQPGHRSSHITTKMPAEVTRTTVMVSGEIADSLGQTVVGRGVVYSIDPRPVYSGARKVSGIGGSPAENVGRDGVASVPGAARSPEGDIDLRNSDSIAGPVRSRPAMIDRLSSFLVADAVAGATTSPAAFVEKGEASSGAGFGAFGVLLDNLKPGTVYYVRSYARTAKGEVFYGNQLSFRTADSCFVATASFGTLLHPGVKILRQFRDAFLAGSGAGRCLVDIYYTISPPVADHISRHPALSAAVRVVLLPFIGFSWLALHAGMAAALLCFSGTAAILGWLGSRLRLRP
jgi:uncharacterized delta-60 repeat protein